LFDSSIVHINYTRQDAKEWFSWNLFLDKFVKRLWCVTIVSKQNSHQKFLYKRNVFSLLYKRAFSCEAFEAFFARSGFKIIQMFYRGCDVSLSVCLFYNNFHMYRYAEPRNGNQWDDDSSFFFFFILLSTRQIDLLSSIPTR
jgi:hypothetical protein